MGLSVDTLDFRLLEIEFELSDINYYLDLLEQQIKNLQAFKRLSKEKEIKKLGYDYDHPALQMAEHQFEYEIEFLIPRLFRSPFILTLYSVYESAVIEIARHIKRQKRIDIDINDLKGDFLNRAKKYFKDVIHFPLCSINETWTRITMLSEIRNAIAHANGRIEMLNKGTKQKISNWEKQKIGISSLEGFIFIEEYFLGDTLSLLSSSINDLIKRYKEWDDSLPSS